MDHAKIAERLAHEAGAAATHEDLDRPPVLAAGEAPRKLFASEIAMRSFGYLALAASTIMIVLAMIAVFFGETKDSLAVLKGIAVLALAIPADRWMTRYRAAR